MFQKLKKRKYFIILLLSILVLSFILTPCITKFYKEKANSNIDINTKYSPKVLLADLDFLVKTAENVHPDLYSNYAKTEFEKDLEKAKSQIKTSLTRKEFFLIIAPLISKFDGHSAAYTPEKEVNDYLNNNGKLFPYDIKLEAKTLFITKDYTSDKKIPLGSEIVSINGIQTHEVIEKLLQFESRETEDGKLAELSVRFKSRLWLVFNFNNEFEIEYKDSNKLLKYKAAGVNKKTIDTQSPQQTKYSYKELEGKIGLLGFNSFSDADSLDKFLSETFKQIKDNNIEKLIIDIRSNGGGNYILGERLINYISSKNYKLVDKQEIKASKDTKNYLKEMQFPCFLCNLPIENLDSLTNKVWDAKDGSLATISFEEKLSKENNLKFNGKLYVSVGPFTYSSAAVFANAIKEYKLGILVGKETGGLGVFYSDPYRFKLPNTKLEIGISYRKFYLPGATEKPIMPEVILENKLEDILRGNDVVVEYVREL